MAMATSTLSPRPATLRTPRAGAKAAGLLPFPRRLACATAAREAPPVEQRDEAEPASAAASNGAAVKAEAPPAPAPLPAFRDARWVNGTWDLAKFDKGGGVDWDAVIDAEARRRKWLEDYPEATNTDEAVVFDTFHYSMVGLDETLPPSRSREAKWSRRHGRLLHGVLRGQPDGRGPRRPDGQLFLQDAAVRRRRRRAAGQEKRGRRVAEEARRRDHIL